MIVMSSCGSIGRRDGRQIVRDTVCGRSGDDCLQAVEPIPSMYGNNNRDAHGTETDGTEWRHL